MVQASDSGIAGTLVYSKVSEEYRDAATYCPESTMGVQYAFVPFRFADIAVARAWGSATLWDNHTQVDEFLMHERRADALRDGWGGCLFHCVSATIEIVDQGTRLGAKLEDAFWC